MKGWKDYKFSDFVNINPIVQLNKASQYSFVEMKNIDGVNKYCEPQQYKYLSGGSRFQNDDTLFARITPCLENGKIAKVRNLINGKGFGSTEFLVFRAYPSISNDDFVYYLARWNEVRDFSEKNMEGSSGRQRVSKECFSNLILNLPQLAEQRAIAAVLSSLDDKIDLLHRQNATLEAMAEALFRQWFVVEAKDEWEEITIDEVIIFYDSQRIPLSQTERDKKRTGELYPYYGAAEIMDYINEYIFDGDYLLIAEDGTVRNELGFPILQRASGKFWVNNHTHIVRAKEPYTNDFIYIYLLKRNIDEIITGAVQPKISQGNLKKLKFFKYPNDLVLGYNNLMKPYFEKIRSNQSQIRTLERLRDTLLPKLMSGEVRVDY